LPPINVDFLGGLVAGGAISLILLAIVVRTGVQHRLQARTIQFLQANLSQSKEVIGMTLNRLLRIANSSFDAIIVIDAEKRVTVLNDLAEGIFEIEGSVIGDTLIGVTGSHQLDRLAGQVVATQEPQEDQIEIDNRSYKVRVSWVDERTIVLALQDVTEMLRLARARRDMVANISHELRTPISSIRLMIDTLTQNYGKNPERDLNKLAKIDRETESLQYLVQELHDLSMIETGKAIMRMIETPFNTIAQDALGRMSSQLEQKALKAINEIPDSIIVLADPDQTRRVLTNLISNAIKFTPGGGRITLSAVPNERGDGQVTIRVADTGVGIPPNERGRVFERFYQVDSARSGESHGSGLGLAIAKHIIGAQGGTIWAEAAYPNGACIAFTLPLVSA
jgi:two-component system, OmpR family, phosphate regulon sensor histidine kinase PhoR